MEGDKWSSLAPPAMLITILTAIRSYALIVLYFAYRTYQRFDNISIFNSFDLFLDFLLSILPAILVIASGIMDFRRFRFRLGEEQLFINSGWIRREKKSIPIDKIQSVQIEQNWLYQFLNVYLVKIDTIGEDKLEVEIGGIWEQDALDLKARIQTIKKRNQEEDSLTYGDPDSIAEPEETYTYTLTNPQVSRYAITENLLWFLLPLTLSFIVIYRLYNSADAQQLSWQLIIDLVFGNLDPTGTSFGEENFTNSYFILYGLLLATFSSGMYFFNKVFGLFNYELVFRNNEIHIRRGLINKFETIVPQRKIQFTTWYTNFIRQKLGIYTLAYKYAGNKKTLGSNAIVPFFDFRFVGDLNQPYIRMVPEEESVTASIEMDYLWRNYMFVKVPASALIIIICYWIHPWVFYASFGVLVYFWVYNLLYVRHFRIQLYKDYFFIQKGVWGRRYILVKWEKLQKIELRQSPHQRSKNSAHISLHTASSNITIPYLNLKTAREMLDYGLYRTENSREFLF